MNDHEFDSNEQILSLTEEDEWLFRQACDEYIEEQERLRHVAAQMRSFPISITPVDSSES